VNLVVTTVVSLATKPRPEGELVGLVYSLTPRNIDNSIPWYKRPIWIASGVAAMALVLNFLFR
jgi:SSS family solute:Na+ symporter